MRPLVIGGAFLFFSLVASAQEYTNGRYASPYLKGCPVWGKEYTDRRKQVPDGTSACVSNQTEIALRMNCPSCMVGEVVICKNGTWTGQMLPCKTSAQSVPADGRNKQGEKNSTAQVKTELELNPTHPTKIPQTWGSETKSSSFSRDIEEPEWEPLDGDSPYETKRSQENQDNSRHSTSTSGSDGCVADAQKSMQRIGDGFSAGAGLCEGAKRMRDYYNKIISVLQQCPSAAAPGDLASFKAELARVERSVRDSCAN